MFDLPRDADNAVVLQPEVSDPDDVDLAWEARDGCPGMAIEVEES